MISWDKDTCKTLHIYTYTEKQKKFNLFYYIKNISIITCRDKNSKIVENMHLF